MENEKLIRQQMEETRSSLTDKLESLESKVGSAVEEVTSTVQEATSAVSDTVENIKETVQTTIASVHESVENTVSAVKETVQESVHTVKDLFDVSAHVTNYPWLMMGGSVLLGYFLERLLSPAEVPQENVPAPEETSVSEGRPALPPHSNGHRHKRRPEKRSFSQSSWLKSLEPELVKLKGLAVATLLGTMRETVVRSIPENIGHQLGEIIDGVTQKLGGTPIPAVDREKESTKEHAGKEPAWRR